MSTHHEPSEPSAPVSSPPGSVDGDIDVIGIGNSLVDVLVHEHDDKIAELGMIKGAMNLVDETRSAFIYDRVGPAVEISGGSVANSTVGVASFGGTAHYLGKVRDDQLGRVFGHDIRANGVGFTTPAASDGPATGCCIILVTPDAQRTMNTYLGAAVHLSPADVPAELIARGKVTLLEGYLFDPPEAQEAFRTAARFAHEAGRKVAVSLSDPFCVDRHREAFADLVQHHTDVVIANAEEICSLYRTDDLDEAVRHVRKADSLGVITRGEKGSLIVTDDDVIEVPAHPVAEVVDTTGAGDLYAAGFLFGLARNYDLADCGALGSRAASEVIGHLGARPERSLAELAADLLRP